MTDDNFKKAVELTEQEWKKNLPAFGKGYCEKWTQLISCWNQIYTWDGIEGLMFHVLHKIYWGIPTMCEYTETQMEIIMLVEDEIKNNPRAKTSWMKTGYIEEILDTIKDIDGAFVEDGPCCVTMVHKLYLNARVNIILGQSDVFDRSWFRGYMKAIQTLLPEAEKWSESMWMDEKEIFKGMAERYGIIFDENDPLYRGDNYEAFIRLIMFKAQRDRRAYVAVASQFEGGSPEMLHLIWPKVRKHVFVNLLQDMVESAKKYKGHKEDVLNCWVFKQVDDWNSCGCLRGNTKANARKAVFDLHTACI